MLRVKKMYLTQNSKKKAHSYQFGLVEVQEKLPNFVLPIKIYTLNIQTLDAHQYMNLIRQIVTHMEFQHIL